MEIFWDGGGLEWLQDLALKMEAAHFNALTALQLSIVPQGENVFIYKAKSLAYLNSLSVQLNLLYYYNHNRIKFAKNHFNNYTNFNV